LNDFGADPRMQKSNELGNEIMIVMMRNDEQKTNETKSHEGIPPYFARSSAIGKSKAVAEREGSSKYVLV
jgi:hypothetical protein